MKKLPKPIAKALQDAEYTRVEIIPRAVKTGVVDADGAMHVEVSEVSDLFVWPGNLKDPETKNWPALDILGDAGAEYDEAQEVSNGALRIRNLRLDDGGGADIEYTLDPVVPARADDPDPSVILEPVS